MHVPGQLRGNYPGSLTKRMEIIGVLDIRRGKAVHAVAGRRDQYAPVASAAGAPVDGDARALARVYVERLGVRELYVADLDAIVDGRPQAAVTRDVASSETPVWVDAGVTSVDLANDVVASGARGVIVGLETLPSWAVLERIVASIGSDRVAFSLDLRNAQPLHPSSLEVASASPSSIAARAAQAGAGMIIVLDLARVGAGTGLDVDAVAAIRDANAHVRLAAGGGVRDVADLQRLAGIGCDAALVATALHDGRIDRAAVAALRAARYRSVSR